MNSAARLTSILVLIAGLALAAMLALESTREPAGDREDPDATRDGRSEAEADAGDGSLATALEGVSERTASSGDDRTDGELADEEDASGPEAPDPAPTMRDVEIIRAEVEARFAGASSETLGEALRNALRGGANEAAQAALRSHIEGVHAAKLAAGEVEVLDADALERLGIRELRWAEQPTLFNGQYDLHELADGRDARTEVEIDDFAASGVDFELAIETVWLEKLYFDAKRAEAR